MDNTLQGMACLGSQVEFLRDARERDRTEREFRRSGFPSRGATFAAKQRRRPRES